MGCAMGELYAVDLILFVLATFAAAFVTGLAGPVSSYSVGLMKWASAGSFLGCCWFPG